MKNAYIEELLETFILCFSYIVHYDNMTEILIHGTPNIDTLSRGTVEVWRGVLELCYTSPKLWDLQHVPDILHHVA
jgi:hypothetical protein